MIATKPKNAHSNRAVSRVTRTYVEYEIFYRDDKDNLKRFKVKAKTLRGAIGQARIDKREIVDASARSHGAEWQSVKLDDLDRLMGV